MLHGLVAKSRLEAAPLRVCQSQELINDSSDKRADADLFEELGMGGCFENYTSWVKSNRSVNVSARHQLHLMSIKLTQSCARTVVAGCLETLRNQRRRTSASSLAPLPYLAVSMSG